MKSILCSLLLASICNVALADFNISAVGDIMMGNRLSGAKATPPNFFDDVKPYLLDSDIAFANLEGPIGGHTPKFCNSIYCHTFSQIPDAANILKSVGFNLVSIANNHARDMGESGMNNTVNALDGANVNYAGYPNKPYTFLIRKGKTIGFIAFTANKGMPDYRDTSNFIGLIKEVRSKSDFVIVSMHAGCEGSSWARIPRGDEHCFGENRGNIDATMKLAVDSGADLVLGHGPHVPRGVITYKNKLIAWSLGNFATAAGISVSGISGYAPMLKIKYDDSFNFKSYEVISYRQGFNTGPKLDISRMAETHIKRYTPLLSLNN